MRSLISLSLVLLAAILANVAQASVLSARDCVPGSEICAGQSGSRRDVTPTPSTFYRRDPLTNAKRLARGLPLNPPTRRSSLKVARTPQSSPVPQVTYTGVIQVFSGSSSLGYVASDPNYWTPLLTPDITTALQISFQLNQGATGGSQFDINQLNDNRGALFAPVVGRDSTSSDIAVGSFNYLYLDPTAAPGTTPGATPQSVPSYFSTSSGLNKQAETSVWSVDLISGDLTAQWINSDSSTPATIFYVQSNHLYAGGDASAFNSRFPAPVTGVTLRFIPN